MRNIHIVTLALAATALSAPALVNAATVETKYEFHKTTPLATGNWIKISVNGSGVYEISYDRLREMGFSDPSKVAVYGTGGTMKDINFLNLSGKRLIEDAIQPIAAVHGNNKIVFYALGNVHNDFTLYNQIMRYRRTNLNLYSEKTYFMLTDSHPVGAPEQSSAPNKGAAGTISTGFGGIYHELDKNWGVYQTGRFWYGEDLTEPSSKATFPNLKAKYCVPNMNCNIFVDIALSRLTTGSLAMEINGVSNQRSLSSPLSTVKTYYSNYSGNMFKIDSNHVGTADLSIYGVNTNGGVLWLDYWTISYPMSLEYAKNDPTFDQEIIGFNNNGYLSVWKHPVPENTLVWDITEPMNPVQLETENGYFYSTRPYQSTLIAFNPSRTMKQINPEFEKVPNRNLHALQDKAVDMLIFTTPELVPYARQLAQLHKEHDGVVCEIVTPQELYDEFNAGTPEATCYRLMAKMLYQHPEGRLKNVLFFGPLVADMRNKLGIANMKEGMIGYQDEIDDLENIPALGMDFYGIMADNLRGSRVLADATVSVGVGILPVDNAQQAETTLAKIKTYLETEDLSGLVNETFGVGCPGDQHMHENQTINLGNTIQSDYASRELGTQFVHETLWMEPLSKEQFRARIQNAMKRGKGFFYYIGHAMHSNLYSNAYNGFTIGDALTAGNTELGLGFFAGCDLTSPDKGMHGIGDLPVIASKSGFIGNVCATRTVESHQNFDLIKTFVRSIFIDANGKLRTETPTIGEVFALSKTRTNANSEVAYVYVGDPSLRIPFALTKVSATVDDTKFRSGQVATVTGKVLNAAGGVRTDYNGYVTVKLMEPVRRITTEQEYNSQNTPLPKMADYDINDLPIMAVRGTVTNGEFTVKLPLPQQIDNFAGTSDEEEATLPIYIGTYDNTTRLGGAGDTKIALASVDSDNSGSEGTTDGPTDTTAPTIIMSYDKELSVVNISVSDDCAILPGIGAGTGTTLTINDKDIVLSPTTSLGVAVTEYSGAVDVARLGAGRYVATAKTRDLSGNTSEKSLTLTIENPAQMLLTANSEYAVDSLDFSLAGAPNDNLNLIIATAEGNVVKDTEITSSKFTLDTTDIPAGTYSAAVRKNSARGEVVKSNWVTFTVID